MNPRLRIFLLLAASAVFVTTLSAQSDRQPLKVGDPAPALQVDELLQAPAGATVNGNAFKGKVVVLDFWATWCSPCLASLPHLNKLVAEFSNDPVVFIAVTDDEPEKLAQFFKAHPIHAWVGIDRKRANWRSFDVVSIPHAMIIDREGKIAAITFPENISGEALRRVLKGEAISLPPKQGRPGNLEWDDELIEWKDGVPPYLLVVIKPIKTSTGGSWVRPEGDRLTADGVPLSVLIQMAFKVDSHHLDLRIPVPKDTYRMAARAPRGREAALLPLFQETLRGMFAFSTQWENQERDVFVLHRAEGAPPLPASTASDGLTQSMRGKITLKKQPTGKLCEFLSGHLGAPVLDETRLRETYDFELPYQPGDPQVLTGALEKLGFRLERTRRPIAVLVVEGADSAAADQAFAALSSTDDPTKLADLALNASRRFPNDDRVINIIVNLGPLEHEMAPAAKIVFRRRAKALLAELASRSDLPGKTGELVLFSELRRESYAQEKTDKLDPQALKDTVDTLRARNPNSAWLPGAEEIYTRALAKIDPAAAEAHLETLLAGGHPDVERMAKGELNVMRLRRVPLDLRFTALDGRTVDFSQLRGRVVLIDFWATWCKPCVQQMPMLKSLLAKYRERGFEIVGVSLDVEKDRQKLIDFLAREQIPWPQSFEGKRGGPGGNQVAANFNVVGVPAMFLMSRDGLLVSTESGGDALEAMIEKQLGN